MEFRINFIKLTLKDRQSILNNIYMFKSLKTCLYILKKNTL